MLCMQMLWEMLLQQLLLLLVLMIVLCNVYADTVPIGSTSFHYPKKLQQITYTFRKIKLSSFCKIDFELPWVLVILLWLDLSNIEKKYKGFARFKLCFPVLGTCFIFSATAPLGRTKKGGTVACFCLKQLSIVCKELGTWDRRRETWCVRQEAWDRKTWERRHETWDRRHVTRDKRQETRDRSQETRDRRQERGDKRRDVRQLT